MKKYFLIFITIISISACSLSNDDNREQYFQYVPITEVQIPNEFTFGETYQIRVSYTLPNGCYSFYNYDYVYEGTARIVGTVAIVDDNLVCIQTTVEGEYIINVEVRQTETYIFKFWQRTNNQGTDEYLIIEVPVI